MTVGGPNPNKPCVLPFQYHNMTFNTCTYYDGVYDEVDDKAWCATKVDGSNNHFSGDEYDQQNWGNCGPNCPVPEGKSLHLKTF